MSAILSERHVQAIWYDAALRPANLTTRRGTPVTVVSPGDWNLGAGPDFRHAVLEVGREKRRLVGDVEVHLCPSDWDFHRHGADPAYRNVVAHVTWGCGPDPETLPGGAITIWLGRFVTANTHFSPQQIDLEAYPFAQVTSASLPCAERYANDPDGVRQLLVRAGRHRLRMKARRLMGRLAERPQRRQVFYEEVMSALGYSNNVVPFRRVAERVPLDELPDEVEVARAAMRTAGSFEEWDRHDQRPQNRPELRLERAADVFRTTGAIETAEATDFSTGGVRRMTAAFVGERLMGRGRAAAIVANVVVPFAIAEGRLAEAPEWLPAEDVSAPVRRMAYRLLGRDHNPAAFYATNGLCIQGLLQIYRDTCVGIHPDCVRCPLA